MRSRWKAGDVLSIELRLSYWTHKLTDTRPQFQGVKALMMGPHIMAGEAMPLFYVLSLSVMCERSGA